MSRFIVPVALITLLWATPVLATTSDSDREDTARELQLDGERALEATDPAGALEIFEKVIKEYPETGSAPFAKLRRVQSLVYLDRCNDAISAAMDLIEEHSTEAALEEHADRLLVCWAQYWIGEAFLKNGERTSAVIAFRRVKALLPERAHLHDSGPLDRSRRRLGELCDPYIKSDGDIREAVRFLGVVGDEDESRAEVYAILAAHLGKDGRIDLANPVLDRIRNECPEQKEELDWATIKVATSYLNNAFAGWDLNGLAIGMLESIIEANRDTGAAQACLTLARFYRRTGSPDKAEEVLRAGKDAFLGTAQGPEILYELGNLLRRLGRDKEAVQVFEELLADKRHSPYHAPARQLAEDLASVKHPTSFAELIEEAHKNFDPEWRHLASSPKRGELDDPVVLARQIVAMSKDRDSFIELAFPLVDKIAEKEGYSEDDVERAKSKIIHCFLETASVKRKLSGWPDTIAYALRQAGKCIRVGHYEESKLLYQALLELQDLPDEVQAGSMLGIGVCEWNTGRSYTARRLIGQVVARFPDTMAARRAEWYLHLWEGGEL